MKFVVKIFLAIFILLVACKVFKIHWNLAAILYDLILPPIYKEKSEFNQIITNEALMETTHLIELYGYPAENHTVITDDGYVITLHRIPRAKKHKSGNGIPIYLQHGAFTTSASWLVNEEESWGFLLADEGYDVWMGNFRDNSYTRKLNDQVPDEDKLIGWDKLSDYEIPAIVNYIINVTGFDQILAVGHSLGTTTMFASLITHPELNNKIKGFVAMAPITSVRYSCSVFFKVLYLLLLGDYFPIIFNTVYNKSILPRKLKIDLMLRLCHPISQSFLCTRWIYYTTGYNSYDLNKTRIPIYMLHFGDSLPERFAWHFFQARAITHELRGFDYGKERNIARYTKTTPKIYDLTKIKIPVAVISSVNDVFASPIEVEKICRQLSNLVYRKEMSGQLTTHTDIITIKTKEAFDNALPILSSMWYMK